MQVPFDLILDRGCFANNGQPGVAGINASCDGLLACFLLRVFQIGVPLCAASSAFHLCLESLYFLERRYNVCSVFLVVVYVIFRFRAEFCARQRGDRAELVAT